MGAIFIVSIVIIAFGVIYIKVQNFRHRNDTLHPELYDDYKDHDPEDSEDTK